MPPCTICLESRPAGSFACTFECGAHRFCVICLARMSIRDPCPLCRAPQTLDAGARAALAARAARAMTRSRRTTAADWPAVFGPGATRGAALLIADAHRDPPRDLGARRGGRAALDACGADGVTALMVAAMNNDALAVRRLAAAGARVDAARTQDRRTALSLAAAAGHVEAVRALLAAGASVDVSDVTGRTPLMFAAAHDRDEVADALLDRGASWTRRNRLGLNALMVAALHGCPHVVMRLLLRAAACDGLRQMVEARGGRRGARMTPLMFAVVGRHHLVVQILVVVGRADVNARTDSGFTPLMLAAVRDDGLPPLLISFGADVDARSPEGMTAPQYAALINQQQQQQP